ARRRGHVRRRRRPDVARPRAGARRGRRDGSPRGRGRRRRRPAPAGLGRAAPPRRDRVRRMDALDRRGRVAALGAPHRVARRPLATDDDRESGGPPMTLATLLLASLFAQTAPAPPPLPREPPARVEVPKRAPSAIPPAVLRAVFDGDPPVAFLRGAAT